MTARLLVDQTTRAILTGQRKASVPEIIRAFARSRSLTYDDLVGRSIKWHIAHARQDAMALVRQLRPSYTLARIGRAFGRDRGTVRFGLVQAELRRQYPDAAPRWVPRDLRAYYASVSRDQGEHVAARYVRELMREAA